MIATDLTKLQALDANPKAIQKMNLVKIYSNHEIQQCFPLLKKEKKLFWIFHKEL